MVSLHWLDVGCVWLAMAVHAGWCLRTDRRLAREWLVASGRAVAQLGALGFVLTFLLRENRWEWTGAAIAAMLSVSAWTAVSRSGVRYPRLFVDCLVALLLSLAIAVATIAVSFPDTRALRDAAITIPLLGILLGNSLSGLSLGLAQWLRELRQRRSEVEFWLALGATRDEAIASLRASALRTALTTVLNSMAVAGLVSIPGMMTGQLLAGGDVREAVHYQLVVLFLIAAVVFGSSTIAFRLSTRRLFDRWGALRADLLSEAP